jgi:glutamyl-tRNA reductase
MEAVSIDDESELAIEDATARIQKRGERIRQTEQARALDRLRARRDLTEHEADVVRDLAQRLTDKLLAVPETHLDAVRSGEADLETAAEAIALFGEE